MKKLCTVMIVLAVVVVGVGFYRGWFAVSSNRHVDDHKVNVNLTVDEGKMSQDGAKVKDKAKELTGQARELTGKAKE